MRNSTKAFLIYGQRIGKLWTYVCIL